MLVNSDLLILKLLEKAEELGLSHVTPVILSDAGNLIVHLSPYPVVARIAKLFNGDNAEFWKDVLTQELNVVDHLISHRVPVVSLSFQVPPGPHKICSTWLTLWDYAEQVKLPPLEGREAIDRLDEMTIALNAYKKPLPILGAWKNVSQASQSLKEKTGSDIRISSLLQEIEKVEKDIQHVELFPAHGDAHPNNFIPTATGWKWIDFEDVSFMPKFWDFASFIGNTLLFHGAKHPIVDHVLNIESVLADKKSFQIALKARVVMSISTNLSLALDGNGDLEFARSQLNCFDDFLSLINKGL